MLAIKRMAWITPMVLAFLPACEEAAPIRKQQCAELKKESSGQKVQATAAELYHEFQVNAALADEKYTEKRVAVSGPMIRVTSTSYVKSDGSRGSIYGMEMGTGEADSDYIYFRFDEDARKDLAAVKQNEWVTIEGHCKGLIPPLGERVQFWDCKIVSKCQ
jgi:hypothetical protein